MPTAMLHHILCLLIPLAASASTEDPLVVRTSYGALRGYAAVGATQVFKAIPFAAPPVGELRFAKPVEPQKWSGVRNATEYNPGCLANSTFTTTPEIAIDEDCLYLAVFTSEKCRTTRDCPVMVYYHGGGFYFDTPVMIGDAYIVEHYAKKDVVFVLPGYRLGLFGLFELDTLVPPNLLLYDVLQALQFVNHEIAAFGGDPSLVTVIGHSTGGFLATAIAFSRLLNASPETRLFRRVINLSGSIKFTKPQDHIRASQLLLRQTGCAVDNLTAGEQLNCLRGVPALELLRLQRDYEDRSPRTFGFRGLVPGGEFFHDHPYDILHYDAPPVDMLFASAMNDFPGVHIAHDMGWKLAFRNTLAVDLKYDHDAAQLHLGESGDNQVLFASHCAYGRAAIRDGSIVYLMSLDDARYATHTTFMYYGVGLYPAPLTPDEHVIMSLFPNYLVNFSRTGIPADDWKTMKSGLDNYYSLDVKLLSGRKPENRAFFKRKVVDYWLNEMTRFDEWLSKPEVGSVASARTANVGTTTSSGLPMLALVSMASVFLAAIVLALAVRNRTSRTRDSIDGERTPLLIGKLA